MKDEVIPTTIPSPSRTTTTTLKKENSSDHAGLFGKTRYKFWALAAILLLAFWSMFTGSVNLKWSAANLARFSDHHHSLTHDDLDILVLNHCLCHSCLIFFLKGKMLITSALFSQVFLDYSAYVTSGFFGLLQFA